MNSRLACIHTRALRGLEAVSVQVEVHLAPGLPGINIVGLPEASVRESRDRVKAAIASSGYQFPLQRITCNLAPADLPKEGSRFDLAIALGILAASGQIPAAALDRIEVLGELSLSGDIRPVPGCLPAALQATADGRALLVPRANVQEAGLAGSRPLYTADHLGQLCAALHTDGPEQVNASAPPAIMPSMEDLADVHGQPAARRALEVAAAGGHSLLLAGPPGSGKSMLARRLPGLLPPPDDREALEIASIRSINQGGFDPHEWGHRPFRAPHHTASSVALVGGGSIPRPGEITLAHLGVLFLDELPEFDRKVLEVLREPLENGHITISRAANQMEFPARFQLVAAMNPCPCGWLDDVSGRCRCTPEQVARYRSRISGPLLDRIDLQLFIGRVESGALRQAAAAEEDTATVAERVRQARLLQLQRQGHANAALAGRALERHAHLAAEAENLLQAALQRNLLTARSYHRCLRVARTLADMTQSQCIEPVHVAEALRYRALDRPP